MDPHSSNPCCPWVHCSGSLHTSAARGFGAVPGMVRLRESWDHTFGPFIYLLFSPHRLCGIPRRKSWGKAPFRTEQPLKCGFCRVWWPPTLLPRAALGHWIPLPWGWATRLMQRHSAGLSAKEQHQQKNQPSNQAWYREFCLVVWSRCWNKKLTPSLLTWENYVFLTPSLQLQAGKKVADSCPRLLSNQSSFPLSHWPRLSVWEEINVERTEVHSTQEGWRQARTTDASPWFTVGSAPQFAPKWVKPNFFEFPKLKSNNLFLWFGKTKKKGRNNKCMLDFVHITCLNSPSIKTNKTVDSITLSEWLRTLIQLCVPT